MAVRRLSPLYAPDEGADVAPLLEAKKKRSPLYGKGKEEWQAQPSGNVDDKDNVAGSPDNKGSAPTPEEAMRTLGQMKANVGRDASPKWRSIKTVGTRV